MFSGCQTTLRGFIVKEIVALTDKELSDFLASAKAEKVRRQKILAAVAEIKLTLKKHNLSMKDVEGMISNEKDHALTKENKIKIPKKKRAKAAVKFKNPYGSEFWTGRGRTPRWVITVCEKDNITVAEFKNSIKFLVK